MITDAQCRVARAALGLTIRQLATLADVSKGAVDRLERGRAVLPATVAKLRRALEQGGILFVEAADGGGAGVRLRETAAKDPPPVGAASVAVVSRPYRFLASMHLPFVVWWRGQRITVYLPLLGLQSLGLGSAPTEAEAVRCFHEHQPRLLSIVETALAAGRAGADRSLYLNGADFCPSCFSCAPAEAECRCVRRLLPDAPRHAAGF